ncbi:MAG: hypothetical protein C4310_06175 [Chloroflexota bacterium]
MVQASDLFVRRRAGLSVIVQQHLAPFAADVHRIHIAQVGQVQVKRLREGEGPHALAKGMWAAWAQAFNAHQGGVFSPLLVMLIGEAGAEDLIQQLNGVQVAGVHAQDDGGLPVKHRLNTTAIQAEAHQLLALGQEDFLGRQDALRVV